MANDPVLIAYAARRSRKGKKVQYERIGRAYPPFPTSKALDIRAYSYAVATATAGSR